MFSKKQFLKDLAKLVAFGSVSTNYKENKKQLDFIVSKIRKGASLQRIKNKKTEILIAATEKSMHPDVAYLVHADVVHAEKDQFKMRVKGNRAYGRGTSDMKYSIPLGYSLLNKLIERKSELSFTFVVTTDEEIGGADGAKYLAEKLKFRPKIMIVPDGGDGFLFVRRMKGLCSFHIEARGVAGHASMPWLGKSANELLIRFSHDLIRKYEMNSKRPNWDTTVNIGVIRGGVSSNQIALKAHVKVDMRFPEHRDASEIEKELKMMARSVDKSIKVKMGTSGHPTSVSVKLPAVKSFIASIEKTIGKKVKICEEYGTTDARHFAPYKIPILTTKPFGANIHSNDEWIDIKECLLFYKALERYLRELECS